MEIEFKPWPKIPRDKGNIITITEKMDGTNGCIVIKDNKIVAIQSRNRFIKLGDDNYGFALWVSENEECLLNLGEGHHYGEWVGPGIQKNPHNLDKKTFFLFNTFRPVETLPECVKQVKVLYNGAYSLEIVEDTMEGLKLYAKVSEYKPEGIVIYNHDSRTHMKKTFKFSEGKWKK